MQVPTRVVFLRFLLLEDIIKKNIPRKRLLDPCGWQPWKYGSHLGLWQVSRKVPAETEAWHVLFVTSLGRKPGVWCLELIRTGEFHSEVTFLFRGNE